MHTELASVDYGDGVSWTSHDTRNISTLTLCLQSTVDIALNERGLVFHF